MGSRHKGFVVALVGSLSDLRKFITYVQCVRRSAHYGSGMPLLVPGVTLSLVLYTIVITRRNAEFYVLFETSKGA